MDEELIRDELQRVLSSKAFAHSSRLSDFLSYIVESTLDKKGPVLSEVIIAQDVFGKTETFDSKKDATIRVSANRLRKSLEAYYQKQGAQNPIRISIPVGGYTPVFQTQSNPKTPSNYLRKLNPLLLLSAMVAILIFIGAWHYSSHTNSESLETSGGLKDIQSYPTIVVLPFENITGDDTYDDLESQFQRQIVRDLYAFDLFKVASSDAELSEIISDENSSYSYVIMGSLISLEPELKVFSKLIDVETKEVIAEKQFTNTDQQYDYFSSIAKISAELATAFASHRGSITQDNIEKIGKRVEMNTLEGNNLTAFECFSLFEQVYLKPSASIYDKAWQCVHVELEKNPYDATIMAAQAMLYRDVAYMNQNPSIKSKLGFYRDLDLDPNITTEMSTDLARKAVDIAPNNDFALMIWAQIQIGIQNYEGALFTLEQILKVKPYDPDVLSNYANLQSLLGNFDKAISLSEEALARTDKPQHFHFLPLLYSAVAQKDVVILRKYIEPFKTSTIPKDHNVFIIETTIAILENDMETIETNKIEHEKVYRAFEGDLFANLRSGGGIAPDKTIEVLQELFESAGVQTMSDNY